MISESGRKMRVKKNVYQQRPAFLKEIKRRRRRIKRGTKMTATARLVA